MEEISVPMERFYVNNLRWRRKQVLRGVDGGAAIIPSSSPRLVELSELSDACRCRGVHGQKAGIVVGSSGGDHLLLLLMMMIPREKLMMVVVVMIPSTATA